MIQFRYLHFFFHAIGTIFKMIKPTTKIDKYLTMNTVSKLLLCVPKYHSFNKNNNIVEMSAGSEL